MQMRLILVQKIFNSHNFIASTAFPLITPSEKLIFLTVIMYLVRKTDAICANFSFIFLSSWHFVIGW